MWLDSRAADADVVVIGSKRAIRTGLSAQGCRRNWARPTAAAVANAMCAHDGVRRFTLPLARDQQT